MRPSFSNRQDIYSCVRDIHTLPKIKTFFDWKITPTLIFFWSRNTVKWKMMISVVLIFTQTKFSNPPPETEKLNQFVKMVSKIFIDVFTDQ